MDGAPAQSRGYDAAIWDLEAGRYTSAIDELESIVNSQPSNLGALLDLAIARCLSGAPDQAARIFLQLESRPDLPPPIAEVIAYYRSGHCTPRPIGLLGLIAAGVGYAHNLNLAPLSSVIPLPGLGVDLALAEGSRPRSSAYSQLEGGLLFPLTVDRRWTLGAFAQSLRHVEGYSRDYDLGSAQASLNYRNGGIGGFPGRTEAQLAHARLWLGGRAHLGATVASGSMLAPLGTDWSAGGALAATRLAYSELGAFNSRQLELRARSRWQSSAVRLTVDAGWHHDEALAQRPGGDRRGPVLQIQANWLAGPRDAVDLTLRQTWLRDASPYNVTLFGDLRRSSRQTSLQFAWRHALTPRLNARLDYRYHLSRDPLQLFVYNAQTATASLEWTFSR